MAPSKRAATAPPSSPPSSFFQFIKKGWLETMPIPESFYDHHYDGLLSRAIRLRGPSGTEFQVDVGQGGSFCKNGWKSFCRSNQVKEGYMLVFKVTGQSSMSCEIFNENGSSKDQEDAPSTSRKRSKGAAAAAAPAKDDVDDEEEEEEEDDGDKNKQPMDIETAVATGVQAALTFPDQEHQFVFTNCEVRLSVKKLGGTIRQETVVANKADVQVSTPKKSSAATEKPTVKAAAVVVDVDSPRSTRSTPVKASAGKSSKNPTPTSKAKPTPKKVVVKTPAVKASSVKKTEKKPAPKAATEKKASVPKKTPLVLKPVKAMLKKIATKTKAAKNAIVISDGETPKKSGDVQTAGEAAALARAESFTSDNPCAVVVMRKSHVAPSFVLSVPRTFAREHLPQSIAEFDMMDDKDKAWTVRWLPHPKFTFSGGWCHFAQAHKITKGDVCVVEVVDLKSDPKKVKVHIFRATNNPAAGNNVAADNNIGEGGDAMETEAAGILLKPKVTHDVEALAVREPDDEDKADSDYNPNEEEAGQGEEYADAEQSPKRIGGAAA